MSKLKKNKKPEIKTPMVKLSLQERHKRIWDALFYSHQRLDTLLIAISGAGIYVVLETIKYLVETKKEVHPIIHVSAIMLLASIVSNFFSQWCASKAHHHDYCISQINFMCQEDDLDPIPYNQDVKNHECKASNYNNVNSFLSISSIILMSLGLIGITIFFLFIF